MNQCSRRRCPGIRSRSRALCRMRLSIEWLSRRSSRVHQPSVALSAAFDDDASSPRTTAATSPSSDASVFASPPHLSLMFVANAVEKKPASVVCIMRRVSSYRPRFQLCSQCATYSTSVLTMLLHSFALKRLQKCRRLAGINRPMPGWRTR